MDFPLGAIPQGDRVDLHREPGRPRGVDPLQNLRERTSAREQPEPLRVQRIQGNVDAPHAELGKLIGKVRKPRAIRCKRQLAQTSLTEMGRQSPEQIDYALTHQRLTASDADLGYSATYERVSQTVKFIERQKIAARQKGHPVGHAVDAAQITAIGHRKPQISHLPPKQIDQSARTRVTRRTQHATSPPAAATISRKATNFSRGFPFNLPRATSCASMRSHPSKSTYRPTRSWIRGISVSGWPGGLLSRGRSARTWLTVSRLHARFVPIVPCGAALAPAADV